MIFLILFHSTFRLLTTPWLHPKGCYLPRPRDNPVADRHSFPTDLALDHKLDGLRTFSLSLCSLIPRLYSKLDSSAKLVPLSIRDSYLLSGAGSYFLHSQPIRSYRLWHSEADSFMPLRSYSCASVRHFFKDEHQTTAPLKSCTTVMDPWQF